MKRSCSFCRFAVTLLSGLVFFCAALPSSAFVLDWETPSTGSNWTSGSPTISNVDGSGINITVTVSGDNIINSTPAVTNTPISTQNNSLLTDVNWDGSGADTLSFTISFSGTVDSVSLNLLDIDRGNFFFLSQYQDRITNISATGTSVSSPTLSTSLDNSLSGSDIIGVASNGDSTLVLGNENDALTTGNASISFTGNDIDQITFAYTKGPLSPADPTLQRISLGNIIFTVPEPSTWTAGILVILLALGQRWRTKNHS